MIWFWNLINTPKVQLSTLQEIQICIVMVISVVLIGTAVMFALAAASKK